MRTVLIGEHYTYDTGNPKAKIIMFVTDKGKYVGEDVYFFDAIALNPFGEVFQKDYELGFFQSEHVRISTKDEIKKLRNCSPVDLQWMRKKAEEAIKKYWNIDSLPEIIFDPDEPLEIQFKGAYDSNLKAIIFRSEFLILLSIQQIEKVLIHELCHWYLHNTGQDFRDENVRFAKEIIRLGIEDTINIHNPKAKAAYEEAKRELI
ncbi:protein sprT [Cytobacillus kochii]|uniref:protein sprT n=1 Tax=Cytobacillus kochii TaxID=859143 RepID=UPI001CD3830D|nr:protein sprT [Cytobacillus kochii]MCA1025734.1 protein sprT [Cytobacillus kochii]